MATRSPRRSSSRSSSRSSRRSRAGPTSSTPRSCGAPPSRSRASSAGRSSRRAPASCPNSVSRWPPFKETHTQLDRFAKKFELGLISNIDDKLLGETRRHFKTDFDLVVTAQQVRSYKPDPAHFKEAERRIGTKKGWVHVASSYYYDVEPCLKAKVPVIWVNRHKEPLDAVAEEADGRGEDAARSGEAARRRVTLRAVGLHEDVIAVTSRAYATGCVLVRVGRRGVLHRLAGLSRTSWRSCPRSPSRPGSPSSACSPRTPTGITCSGAYAFPEAPLGAARDAPRRG